MDDLRDLQMGEPLLQGSQRRMIVPRERIAPFIFR